MIKKETIKQELERIEKWIDKMSSEETMEKSYVKEPYEKIGWYTSILNNVKRDLETLKDAM